MSEINAKSFSNIDGNPSASSDSSAEEDSLLGLGIRYTQLVQESWKQVIPITDAAATLFYDRLFTLDPSLRALFKNDLSEQKKKLMQTLGVAVDGLKKPKALLPVLERLGVQHVGYMVKEHHYDLVGEALLWTLKEGLGDGFTLEVERAWTEVYELLAGVMKRAAARSLSSVKIDNISLQKNMAKITTPPSLQENSYQSSFFSQTEKKKTVSPPSQRLPAPAKPVQKETSTVSSTQSTSVSVSPISVSLGEDPSIQLQVMLDPNIAAQLGERNSSKENSSFFVVALLLSVLGVVFGILGLLETQSDFSLLAALGAIFGLFGIGFVVGSLSSQWRR